MTQEKRKTLKERMAEKTKQISNGEKPSGYIPSGYDKDQMSFFSTILDDMITLLTKENEAIQKGDLDIVNDLHDIKKEGLRQLEIKSPIIEHQFQHGDFPELKEKIGNLKALIDENGIILERMSYAAKNISNEINKIKNKRSLDGIYEKSGRKIEEGFGSSKKIDQNL